MSVCMPCLSVSKLAKQTQQLAVTDFGKKLEGFMLSRNWNQDQLSSATEPNVSQGQISNYKYGRRNPSRKTIRVLAQALARGTEGEEANYQNMVNTLLKSVGYAEDYPGVEYQYPPHEPLYSIIRDIGLGDQQFTRDDLAEMQSGVESLIEGYAVKKQRGRPAPENAIQQQATGNPSLVTTREMRRHATRLTGEVRARDLRVAHAEAVIWTVDMDGRFLLSEGDGLKQVAISPGQVVGLRIWDVYKDETDFLEKVRMVLASDGPLEWATTVRGTPWRCMTEPLRGAQGTKIGIVGTSLAVPTISESRKQG